MKYKVGDLISYKSVYMNDSIITRIQYIGRLDCCGGVNCLWCNFESGNNKQGMKNRIKVMNEVNKIGILTYVASDSDDVRKLTEKEIKELDNIFAVKVFPIVNFMKGTL